MAALFFCRNRPPNRILLHLTMRRFLCVLTILSCASGCTWRHRKPAAATAIQQPQPRAVGSIALVNEQLGFVLVDVGSLYTPAVGAALKSFSGSEETAVLTVSIERKRPFITADIVKGTPHRGDTVFE
ncbi:MAG: hypothetical protein QOD99_2096 [Chthoniobacter sp.]|jgi:hypothetical protein|nr:hypothetical protein [Chthoniobacter sp.]